MKPKLSIVTLGVEDFDASLKFYRDGLKFPTHNFKDGEDIAFFRLETSWLAIYPRDKLADDATVPHTKPQGFAGFTLARNEKSKADVDKAFAEAVAAGAKPVREPHAAFWGGYSSYIADPDGYLWEIAWNPFTDLS